VKRQAIIIKSSADGKRNIAVDIKNYKVINGFISRDKRHQNKFLDICNIILNNLRNPDLYDKEDINDRCKNVTAMKFFKGQENARIYCQEIRRKGIDFVVVASELLERKKNKKNRQKEINIIEKVAGYEYEIQSSEED
jgi:hypothetical protein